MERPQQPAREEFEQLWLLHACYGRRSDYDRRSVLSLTEAITWAEQQLRLMHIRERWRGFGTINRTT